MSIIIFIIVLLLLILSHEFGHFIVAKRFGIRVDEFGFGFPPRLFSFKKGETKYSFNIIPFGGFVKIFGENPNDIEFKNSSDKERAIISKPKYAQASVLFAGVFFNLLLAWFLLSISFISGLPTISDGTDPNIKNPELTIISILPNSPAEESGLEIGDKIISISSNADMEGVSTEMIGTLKLPVFEAILKGAKSTVIFTKDITVAFVGLIKDAVSGKADLSNITGPIGIVGITGEAFQFGLAYLLSFIAFISINLAVINLIPIPALDGGRLLFLLIEWIKRSPINPKVAQTINLIGFFLLILLMLVVTYQDIVKLF